MTRHHVPGTVYLLHFDRPYQHAAHYMGWTEDLTARLERHRAGDGARLLAVIQAAGIGWTLARTWNGTRALERRLKNRGGHARLCPICRQPQTNQTTRKDSPCPPPPPPKPPSSTSTPARSSTPPATSAKASATSAT